MLRVEKIALARGGRDLFADLSFTLNPGDRIGLVGANGAGKSSLLRVIAGQIAPDAGEVAPGRGERVGYLPQDGLVHAGRTLFEEAAAGMTTLGRWRTEIEAALADLAHLAPEDPRHAEALARHDRAEAAFRALGGYAMEATVSRVLRGLGFADRDFGRDCAEQSGGWQMRIALAKLLLESPEILLLDEPTNHLDIEARTWLEHFLGAYSGAVVVVSHDRAFLDRVASQIWELEAGKLTGFAGNFSRYLAERELRLARLRQAFEEQEAEIRRQELFIRRFRAKATKAAQVQSRLKALDRIERIELPATQERIRFRFPPAPRSGPTLIRLDGATKRYGSRAVLEKVHLTVARGERICLAGPNGAGKSTLLRILAGREPLDDGDLHPDPRARIGYFAQDQAEELPADTTVLAAAKEAAPGAPLAQVRSLLGALLFRGDDVDKPCRVLSGGERSRLALCRILLQEANVLLLDEPTNHLDLEGKETLEVALRHYDGAVVFVSHDRDFVGALATAVVEVGGGRADRYEMGFEDFLWRRAFDLGFRGERVPGVPAPDLWFLRGTEFFEEEAGGGAPPPAAPAKIAYEERRRIQRRTEVLERRVAALEAESARASAEIARIEAEMVSPEVARDHPALEALHERLLALRREEDARAAEWQAAMEELESLRAGNRPGRD
jgi:ATP-binding cassette subfamily F protein 3